LFTSGELVREELANPFRTVGVQPADDSIGEGVEAALNVGVQSH
jgi:hypothetical protein